MGDYQTTAMLSKLNQVSGLLTAKCNGNGMMKPSAVQETCTISISSNVSIMD